MKIQRIAATLSAVLLSMSAAQANSPFTGAYIGIQGGIQNTTSHHFRATIGGINSSVNAGRLGGTIGAFGGYGKLCNKWYFGGQVEGSGGDYHIHATVSSQATRLKASSLWGVAALLGYEVSPQTIGYLRLGADYGKWKLSNNGIIGGSNNKSQFGFAPGLGIRYLAGKNFFVNAEYKSSFFQKINLVNGNNSVSATPHVQTFTLGVAFKV